MYRIHNFFARNLQMTVSIVALLFIAIIPAELYYLFGARPIYPAFDVMVGYFIVTSTASNNSFSINLILLLFGVILDYVYGLPPFSSSVILLLARIIFMQSAILTFSKTYILDVLLFCVYSILVILLKYLIISTKYNVQIGISSLFFYYLTTIFAYPVLKIVFFQIERMMAHAR